jgi:hypothetical protein
VGGRRFSGHPHRLALKSSIASIGLLLGPLRELGSARAVEVCEVPAGRAGPDGGDDAAFRRDRDNTSNALKQKPARLQDTLELRHAGDRARPLPTGSRDRASPARDKPMAPAETQAGAIRHGVFAGVPRETHAGRTCPATMASAARGVGDPHGSLECLEAFRPVYRRLEHAAE